MRRAVVGVAVLALACGGGDSGEPGGRLEVHDAWVAPSPAGHGPAGGFLVLANEGARDRRLVGVSSPDAGAIEIHRSWIEDGVARMAPVDALDVAAGETLRLEPGGLHLMIHEAHGLAPGGDLTLRLAFADGETREVTAEVREAGGGHAH
jgi:copper(I)-binding protein